ncbi:MAG: hypothetical protein JRG86_19565 [Deltaproteobacteria bacterium]|jgi:hypothetical protein|nr:hypothetical protein [Deltaproteobacteria bacterium]
MASIRVQGEVVEIRECISTPAGPRQRALVRFRRILTNEILDRAAALARRPFDRAGLVTIARARGIPIADRAPAKGARELLAHLRAGGEIDPMLVTLLREALAPLEDRPLPEHLEDPSEWLGASEAARGRALRGLLRAVSPVDRSRSVGRETPPEPFPRFASGERFS